MSAASCCCCAYHGGAGHNINKPCPFTFPSEPHLDTLHAHLALPPPGSDPSQFAARMGDQDMSTGSPTEHVDPADPKGKGKAVEPTHRDVNMDEDEESSDDEAEEVSISPPKSHSRAH